MQSKGNIKSIPAKVHVSKSIILPCSLNLPWPSPIYCGQKKCTFRAQTGYSAVSVHSRDPWSTTFSVPYDTASFGLWAQQRQLLAWHPGALCRKCKTTFLLRNSWPFAVARQPKAHYSKQALYKPVLTQNVLLPATVKQTTWLSNH